MINIPGQIYNKAVTTIPSDTKLIVLIFPTTLISPPLSCRPVATTDRITPWNYKTKEYLSREKIKYLALLFLSVRVVGAACVLTHCVLSVSSRYDSCESLVWRSISCLLTDESISRTTSSSWPCWQCRDMVRSLIWFSIATSSARFSISFSIRRKFSSLAKRTSTNHNKNYKSVQCKTSLSKGF